MHNSQQFKCSQDFTFRPPQYRRMPCKQLAPVMVKPNESFYVLIKDVLRQHLPALVVSYRRKFDVDSMVQRHERAKKLNEKLMAQRVERLSKRLESVTKLIAQCMANRNTALLALKQHIVKDMQQHLRRWKQQLAQRVQKLRDHNRQVKRRWELLRYRNYLTGIALQHEEKKKRNGKF